jgi:uncharacterized protein (DUF111 family)
MTKVAYIDSFSGLAGDMLLAALIDAGAPLAEILGMLKTIEPIKGEWDIQSTKVLRSTGRIAANHIKVDSIFNHKPVEPPGTGSGDAITSFSGYKNEVVQSPEVSFAHSHDHSHGASHVHSHEHTHEHVHDTHVNEIQSHEHNHSHSHQNITMEEHHHRGLRDITSMIESSALPIEVKRQAIAAFTELAIAESKVTIY